MKRGRQTEADSESDSEPVSDSESISEAESILGFRFRMVLDSIRDAGLVRAAPDG
jgi:hypothetical protein